MSAGRRAVVIVDDDAVLRATLRHIFEHAGLAVLEAADAATGVTLIEAARPAAVITDLVMPGFGNGGDALKVLRAAPATARLPVFVLSGTASDKLLASLAEPGRTWTFRKPPVWRELLSAVLGAVERGGP